MKGSETACYAANHLLGSGVCVHSCPRSCCPAGAAGQRRDADWGFFRQRDAFFSSSPDCSSGSQGWAPTHRGPRQAGSRRGYARSSISQASSLVEPKDGRETAGASGLCCWGGQWWEQLRQEHAEQIESQKFPQLRQFHHRLRAELLE